jgi:HlyD family type I secretion membrane fusion protein
MVQSRSLVQRIVSIGEKVLLAFGGRNRTVFLRPSPLVAARLPVRQAFSGPLAFLPSAQHHHLPALINTRKPVLVGAIIISIAFVGFGGWAAIAPIDSAAIAPGTIAVESGRQTIQHFEGGIIKQIVVRDGDRVKAGDVLVRLDGTRARAEEALVQGELDLAEATQARLIAERDGLSEPQFPAGLLDRASVPEVAAVIAGQSNVFKARQSVWMGQKDILRQQIAEYDEQIKGYQAIEASKQMQLKLVESELSDLSGLLKQGLVQRSRVLALEREGGELNGQRGEAIAEASRARQGIAEANRKILELDYQRQEDISKDLYSVQGQLGELRQKLVAATDVVGRLDITAPIDGTVTSLQMHTIGGVIGPSTKIMEIVPTNDTLIVEAEINPTDIDTVHAGQEVAIRVVLAGGRLLPVIYGKLDEVSADRMEGQSSSGVSARSYYQARISISPADAAPLGDIKLRVGMPVEAMITRGSHTALHYALKPFLDSVSKAFREQ